MAEQIPHGRGQVVVGVHQPPGGADDPVAVAVRVVAEGDVKPVPEGDETGHGVGGRAVHPDLPVVVDGHEAEGRVDRPVDHLDVQSPGFGDGAPVVDGRAAQRVNPNLQLGARGGLDFDDARQVGDVGGHVVVLVGRARLLRRFDGDAPDRGQSAGKDGVGSFFDRPGDRRVGRPALRRIVLEAPILGRVMGWRDGDAVGQAPRPAPVVGQDGV